MNDHTMQSYRFGESNRLESLKIHEEKVPSPQRGEVLVKIRSVSLNYRDVAVVLGRYVHKSAAGLIPTSDASCEVVRVGEGVDTCQPGDRVLSLFHRRWFGGPTPAMALLDTYGSGSDGWLTQYKVVPQDSLVRMPDSLSWDEGSTLPCAATTAWTALSGPVPIRAGHTVLTLGTGGVSIFALQLAKAVGARVIATTSSEQKAARLRELGADEVVNYTATPNWGEAVKALTKGRGVDRVVEVGGPATVHQSISAVAREGELVLIGFLSSDNPGIDYFHLKGSGASVRCITVGDRTAQEQMVRAVESSGIRPEIDRVYSFESAPEAFERVISAKHLGKVVIRVSE